MKTNFSILALVFAFVTAGASTTAVANPPVQAKPAANAATAQNAKDPSRVPSTMTNYWDANQWDKEGAAAFWHATSDDQPVNAAPAPRQQRAKKGSRLVKKLFNR